MDLRQLERQTVQEFEPKETTGYNVLWFDSPYFGGGIIPSWGEHRRDRALREMYRNQYNWIGQAAVAALIRKVKQVPWTIEGGKNNVAYFQRLLQDAHFKKGWGEFLSRLLLDFLTCDYGAYVEIIARGNALQAIKSRISGVAALDSLLCVPTGNLEYPVIYYSRRTKTMHKLHETRVYRWVDMPDGDESFHLAGLCAMSRALAMIEQQIPLNQFIAASFSDTPPIGVWYNNSGMNDKSFKAAYASFKNQRNLNKGGVLTINNAQLINEAKGSFLPFAISPQNFDYAQYTEIAVNAFAAAFGIDRQDIYPLTGKQSGTATQSEVMAQKAYGMAFGDILTAIERMLNNAILPENVEFRFEYKDTEKDEQVAKTDSIILSNAKLLSDIGVPQQNVLDYLSRNSEQFRDILTDAAGELIELPDDDRIPDGMTVQGALVEGVTPPNENIQVGDNLEQTPNESQLIEDDGKASKAIQATRLAFEDRFDAILKEIREGNLNRTRAGTLIRSLIGRTGAAAYRDGLEDGGVDSTELDQEDQNTINRLTANQSQYVSNFTEELIKGTGISDAQARQKAAMWWNKSVSPFYDAGLLSADKNGMYEWVYGDTEHCDTCLRLNGQVHRLKAYMSRGLYPKSDQLDCNGFKCKCQFVKSKERARGRF